MTGQRPTTFYIRTYGCQMNKYDSEIVAGILEEQGLREVSTPEAADVVLINTCSVREHAEQRVLGYLEQLRPLKAARAGQRLAVIGCMAERLGSRLLEAKPFVDLAVGPDRYRELPRLLGLGDGNAELSGEAETYEGIWPSHRKGVSAWVAVMRGCDNFCSYCIVPYVRGRERSRPAESVLEEVRRLVAEGFVEVNLLGQNVNSYHDGRHDFADLLLLVADVEGIRRVRFATSHPKDLSEKLIEAIASHPNICPHIHLPVQSGSDRILERMNRRYTRGQYLRLVERIRARIPEVALTTDIIVGFPGETREDFEQTRSLVEEVQFDGAFVFRYSVRQGTAAAQLEDDVPELEKIARLEELNRLQKKISLRRNRAYVGRKVEVLVEGPNRKRPGQFVGRTDTNKIVVFSPSVPIEAGSFVRLRIVEATAHTLFGELEAEQGPPRVACLIEQNPDAQPWER
jgi:tRNA-2-methylthio-N6-dimethylallyladenosine synthase